MVRHSSWVSGSTWTETRPFKRHSLCSELLLDAARRQHGINFHRIMELHIHAGEAGKTRRFSSGPGGRATCVEAPVVFLLVHARSAEGSRVAVRLLQVRQGLFVQLHGVSGKPTFDLATPPMKPLARAHTEAGLRRRVSVSPNTIVRTHLPGTMNQRTISFNIQ